MKLWSPDTDIDELIERFTAGDDPVLDQRLVPYDCHASLAHGRMLWEIGILTEEEFLQLEQGLLEITDLQRRGEFPIAPEDEDCHTAIENHLTARCGEAGRKIHTGRSRNDQVLTAIRLYEKHQLGLLDRLALGCIEALEETIDRSGGLPLPGYTHMQRAMPTDVATWAGSFRSALADDRVLLRAVLEIVDQSPLGTAAGFGVPAIPVDRESVSKLLGFARPVDNPMYAQLSRGKVEAAVLGLCSQILLGINRLASDLLLFATREFGFVKLPAALATGSSIMPQKRNPDVLELLRASYHVVAGEEMKVRQIAADLISGYNRDVQLTKGPLFAGLDTTRTCLEVAAKVIESIEFDEERCRAAISDDMLATERANRRVLEGVPFRDAYREEAARSRTAKAEEDP